jgi:hypothetical protein
MQFSVTLENHMAAFPPLQRTPSLLVPWCGGAAALDHTSVRREPRAAGTHDRMTLSKAFTMGCTGS